MRELAPSRFYGPKKAIAKPHDRHKGAATEGPRRAPALPDADGSSTKPRAADAPATPHEPPPKGLRDPRRRDAARPEPQVFRTQRAAFDFCDECNGEEGDPLQLPPAERFHTFMMQCATPPPPFDRPGPRPTGGAGALGAAPKQQQRFFLATPYEALWTRMEEMHRARDPLHFYEVIPEGKPCHLYLDCEYDYVCRRCRESPGADVAVGAAAEVGRRTCGCIVAPATERAVPVLVRCLNGVLEEAGLSAVVREEHVLELVSEYPHKFSAHYIVHLPRGLCFASNLHMGRFVQYLVTSMQTSADPDVLETLFVRPSDPTAAQAPPLACLIDQAVYTRNRMMRCCFSTKMGKRSPLVVSRGCQYPHHNDAALFFASLICNVDDVGPATGAPRALPHVAERDIELLVFGEDGGRQVFSLSRPRRAPDHPASRVEYGPSPFPELDAFFNDLVRLPDGRGRVRSWVAFWRDGAVQESGGEASEGAAACAHCAISHLIYNVADNRFCLHIGREHRSNAIYFVCDVRAGVYYQKCYDGGDCPNFRSNEFPVPPERRPRCPTPGVCGAGAAGPGLRDSPAPSAWRPGPGPPNSLLPAALQPCHSPSPARDRASDVMRDCAASSPKATPVAEHASTSAGTAGPPPARAPTGGGGRAPVPGETAPGPATAAVARTPNFRAAFKVGSGRGARTVQILRRSAEGAPSAGREGPSAVGGRAHAAGPGADPNADVPRGPSESRVLLPSCRARRAMCFRLRDALAMDAPCGAADALPVAQAIEECLHGLCDGDAAAMRQKFVNLRGSLEHATNADLRARVRSGGLSAFRLVRMSAEELACPQQKRRRLEAKEWCLRSRLEDEEFRALVAEESGAGDGPRATSEGQACA